MQCHINCMVENNLYCFIHRSTTWYYTCFDMTTNVMNTRPDDTNHRLEQAWIARQVWDKDIFVDALYIGSTDTTDDFGM